MEATKINDNEIKNKYGKNSLQYWDYVNTVWWSTSNEYFREFYNFGPNHVQKMLKSIEIAGDNASDEEIQKHYVTFKNVFKDGL